MAKNNKDLEDLQRTITILKDAAKRRGDSRCDAALDNLYSAIDTLKQSTSLITRISNYWNELTLWQKLLGGIALGGFPLALGAVANISFFMEIAGASATAYALSWWLLEDHIQCTKESRNRFVSSAKNVLFFAARNMEIPLEDLNSSDDLAPTT